MNEHGEDTDETLQGDGMEELLQIDEGALPMVPVPVLVDGAVRTRALPARNWVARSYNLDPGASVQIAGDEPRRSRIIVWQSLAGTFYLGASQAEARAQGGVAIDVLSLNGPLVMMHSGEVWAYNADAVNPGTVNVVTELWAD